MTGGGARVVWGRGGHSLGGTVGTTGLRAPRTPVEGGPQRRWNQLRWTPLRWRPTRGAGQTGVLSALALFLSVVAGWAPLSAEPPTPLGLPRTAIGPAPTTLHTQALERARKRGVPTGTISFIFELPDGGRFAHREDAPMAPASALKVLTAVAALDLLGPRHPLRTELRMRGRVRDGVLDGDLIVVGGGDPAPSGRQFDDDPLAEFRPWVEALGRLGIESVDGDLIGDDQYLAGPSRPEGWPRDQLHRWYCAPSGALNLNDNCVDVVIAPREGRIEASLRPVNPLFEVTNAIRPTPREKDHLYSVDRAPDSWKIRLGGKFLSTGSERTEWVTVPDPTIAFLGALRELLRSEGIEVRGELRRGARTPDSHRVAAIEHPVVDALPVLLKNSQNLYGDCLLRVVDRETGGDGSFTGAGSAAVRYLIEHVGGGEGARVIDGSGLARENRIRASDLLRLLERADEAPWRDAFWSSLAVAGEDGTLRRRFRNGPLTGRLNAKTGTIRGVSALCGGWETAAGPVRFAAFSGGRGAKTSAFRRWLDEFLSDLDRQLGGAPAVPSGERAEAEGGL